MGLSAIVIVVIAVVACYSDSDWHPDIIKVLASSLVFSSIKVGEIVEFYLVASLMAMIGLVGGTH